MHAFEAVVLLPEERRVGVLAVEWCIADRSRDVFSELVLGDVVRFAESAGLATEVRSSLEELVRDRSIASVAAAAALLSVLSAEQGRALSSEVASWATSTRWMSGVSEAAFERLLRVAPDAWGDTVAGYLQEPQSIFGPTAPMILKLLPKAIRRRALASRGAADLAPLPWVTEDGPGSGTARPDDTVARLRFDAGVDDV